MEIKDLKSAVKLGSEIADVRGGSRLKIANMRVRDTYTESYSNIYNEGVYADLNVNVSGSQFNGGGFGDIVSAPTNSHTNNVTQTTQSSISSTPTLSNLNFSFA